jgi:hypothetical protein
MAEKQSGAASTLTNNSFFAAVLAVAGALYLNSDAALDRLRPDVFETSPASHAYHDIEARSWQDPLAAVEAHRQTDAHAKTECKTQSDGKHCAQLIDEISRRPDAKIVAVMIPGGPFNEDSEVRRRLRFAVVAGLGRKGYLPDDPQRLDYFQVWADDQEQLSMDLPYEWFRTDSSKPDDKKYVLVLWVNEDGSLLNSDPLYRPVEAFKILFDKLLTSGGARKNNFGFCEAQVSGERPIVPNKCEDFPPAWRLDFADKTAPTRARGTPDRPIAILGPWGSDIYLRINRERCKNPTATYPFEFYVYGASIADDQLKKELSKYNCAPLKPVWRTITDDALAGSMVEELDKWGLFSGAPPSGTRPAVALLSDMDSLYGRNILNTFHSKISERNRSTQVKVVNYSYLRGLDGSLPGNQKNAGEQKKSEERSMGKEQNSEKIDVRAFDRPFGPSQADYLRRIADDLRQQSRSLDFRAIGVLGNDVYDKLWVLRALKPAFPNAIFFTTDYDAALGMRSELRYTRNLLVASGFSDRSEDKSEQDGQAQESTPSIPPFRASYQTSVVLALWQALAADKVTPRLERQSSPPQLFEIARDGRPFRLKPPEATHISWTTEAFAGLIIIAAWIFFIGLQREKDTRERPNALSLQAPMTILVALLMVGALVAQFWRPLILWLTERGDGEPLGVFEGVGAWPVITLHLLLAFFSAFLTWLALKKLRENLSDVSKKFFVGARRLPTKPRETSMRHLVDPFLAFRIDAFIAPVSPVLVQAAWRQYAAQGWWSLRLGRCLIWSIIALFLFGLLGGFDSPPPMRSVRARDLYDLTLGVNFFAACVLTLVILDATVLGVSFVYGLGREQSRWPAKTQKDYRKKLGLSDPPGQGNIAAWICSSKEQEGDKNAGLLDDWVDLDFIQKHTGSINSLVYYPFIAVALSLLAHSAWLSAYPGSPLVLIAEGAGLFVIFCCALALRWAAERARRFATYKFADEIIKMSEKPAEPRKWSRSQLEAVLARIQALDEGAFSPLLEQPFVRALLLPIGSFGLTALQNLPGFLRF